MFLLLDGYNVLHAIGWASPSMRKGHLEAARTKLLDWLAESRIISAGSVKCLVVFDAVHGSSASTETIHRGVRVRYAYQRTADDLIEELLDHYSRADRLIVVSNDSRLQESARRRRAEGWSVERFLDWKLETDRPGSHRSRAPGDEKPTGRESASERDEWLRRFSEPKSWPKRR